MIEQFINEKITQISAYVTAVINHYLHYTELDQFVDNTMAEWTLLHVSDETPSSAQERVFWHIIHELSLHGANSLENNNNFKKKISACIAFFSGAGSYPIECIGWRPIP